jgi:3-dehydroquinate dehydratase-1
MLSAVRPLVIGTVHEKAGLRLLRRGGASMQMLDLVEIRLDCLPGLDLPDTFPLPALATARRPDEGGKGNLSVPTRRRLLEESIPWACAIDVELRSSGAFAPVIAAAHQHGRAVILSHHDFKGTPPPDTLRKLAAKAAGEGADLFKVATFLRDRKDLLSLVSFQSGTSPVPVVAMGMGNAGRFSRLVLAGFGAPLCYGWLGAPQVPGQWPALKLRGLLDAILPA